MYKLWVALSKNVTEIWNIYFIISFPGSRRARKTNIVNFFSEASQRSGILNPWIWLANSARSSVRIFPSGPRVRIALPRASVASSVQAPPTLRRRIWKRKFHSETQRRWNWKRNNHRLIWIWVSKKKTLGQGNHVIIVTTSYSNFSGLKAPLSWRYGVGDRLNCKIETAFSNLSEVVWTRPQFHQEYMSMVYLT